MNTSVSTLKPIVVVMNKLELGGGTILVKAILEGITDKKEHVAAVKTLSSVVKSLYAIKGSEIPKDYSLLVIDQGIYVEGQEEYYKFHYHPAGIVTEDLE